MTDHATCPPSAPVRSLPAPRDGQTVADDGLLACNDCNRPAFYCDVDSQYHHVDPEAACFLIRS